MVKGIRHEVSLLKEVKYPVACKASELHFFFFFFQDLKTTKNQLYSDI